MRTALVTGGTGMLGSYIVEQLSADGWNVRALVRDPAAAPRWLGPLGATLVRGDICDPASLRDASTGCDLIVHSAAAVGPRGAWEPYRLGNVVGTGNVIAAAVNAGARLLHVSSTAVYSHETRYRNAPTTEDVVLAPLPDADTYGRSKLEAERLVLDAAARGDLWASVVRPPPMYGERDRQFVPRLAPVLMRGIFPLVGDGRTILCAVHAASVATGAVRAATTDLANGRAYNLTNDFPVTVASFMRFAALGLDVRLRLPRIPYVAARICTGALAGGLVLTGRGHLTPHAHGTLDMLTRDNPFSSERARRELGWTYPIAPEVGIPAAFRWWREHHGSAKATT